MTHIPRAADIPQGRGDCSIARRPKNDGIGKDALVEYVEKHSDLHFELKIPKLMRDQGLSCEQGGHCSDPLTQKSREFDIRCRVVQRRSHVQIAVECKDLKKNFPLLVPALPRTAEESCCEVAVVCRSAQDDDGVRRADHRRGLDGVSCQATACHGLSVDLPIRRSRRHINRSSGTRHWQGR